MRYYDFEVRITYSETDRMGVIYYANYLVFFERGERNSYVPGKTLPGFRRTRNRNLSARGGRAGAYLHPGRYDDLIKVRTFISELGGANITFRYEINNIETKK